MDNILTFTWLLIFTGLVAMVTGQRDEFCPSDGSIDNCMVQYMPQIHIGGKMVDQTKRVLFMEPLKLNKFEIEDLCRYKYKYEEFLSCVNSLKLNCWINIEIQKLYIDRPQIHRVINYICQNYTHWLFPCTDAQIYNFGDCERQYVRNRTRNQNQVTTRGPITDDNVNKFIRDECVKVQGKEFCYDKILHDKCGYQSRIYSHYLLEVLRPAICGSNQLTCSISAIVTLIFLSLLFFIG